MNSEDGTRQGTERAAETCAADPAPGQAVRYYKGLVGQIEIALPQSGCRVLLISSSVAGEGTTEVAIGLGTTLAAAVGKKTAIVDCNFHHPDMHTRFGTPCVGLAEYLSGEVPLEKALANTVVPNLYVMPVGRQMESFAAFTREDLESLIAALREKFEYVIIDAAPLGAYPECAVLCDKVDAVILVIRHGSTKREVVRIARDVITRTGGKILGAVLNRRRFPIPEFLYRRL
jgi:capsular exopolysaccharide synthesis family protein